MKYNCKTCLFANKKEDGSVDCDKRIFEGKMIHIPNEKVNLNCPSHSSYNREETRYRRPWKFHKDAEDVCSVCGRDINLLDKSQYEYIKIYDDNTFIGYKKRCRICKEKGRE